MLEGIVYQLCIICHFNKLCNDNDNVKHQFIEIRSHCNEQLCYLERRGRIAYFTVRHNDHCMTALPHGTKCLTKFVTLKSTKYLIFLTSFEYS
jgi:hypothetical protein